MAEMRKIARPLTITPRARSSHLFKLEKRIAICNEVNVGIRMEKGGKDFASPQPA